MQQAVTREEFITIGKVLDAACTEFEALLAAEASPCARSLAARKRNYCLPRLERMQFVELVKKSRIASCTPCKVRTICGKVLDRQPVRLSVVPVGLCSIGARRCSVGRAGFPFNILLEPLMPSPLARPRTSAFNIQFGRCFYCGLPMLTGSPEKFAARYGITLAQANLLRCTGEHLVPHENGGTSAKTNIVAACWFCNSRRHRRPTAPAPAEYKQLVRQKVRQGRWNSFIFKKPSRRIALERRSTSP